MKKVTIIFGLCLTLIGVQSVDAFRGGNNENKNSQNSEQKFHQHKSGENDENLENKKENKNFQNKMTSSFEKIDNGVVITLTTEDEDVLAKLYSKIENDKTPRSEDVTVSVEKLDNGIKITRTTTDEEKLARWHENVDNGGDFMRGGFGKGHHRMSEDGEMPSQSMQVEREIENLENGVRMTLTSDDADVVEKLQSREERGPKNEDVSKSKTNIENGVIIEITSDDSEVVKHIQLHETRFGKGQKGQRKNIPDVKE